MYVETYSALSQARMNEEYIAVDKLQQPTARVTRARAKALGTSGGQVHKPPRPEQSRALRAKSKRIASDENKCSISSASLQKKRRATLADVTNVLCEKSYVVRLTGGRFQKNKEKKGSIKQNIKVAPTVPAESGHDQEEVKAKIAEDISKLSVYPQEVALLGRGKLASDIAELIEEHHECTKLEEHFPVHPNASEKMESCMAFPVIVGSIKKEVKFHEKTGSSDCPSIVDIDNHKDPLMCSLYASDIYENKRVTELNLRPSTDYMEKVQQDITPSMRGVLVDWLVEVSEEYKLVPDTLYLTVNLIDRYLSGNYIEKQKLQLLGVTCMLIASKYEEMSAPQVEEFCYITANTYAREEVLKMERQVLNFLCFQLSIPTAKTFLRRYIHASQATCKVPSADLEFLANYLAELTLVEYSFLKFLPSLIAASAVFLARWTFDQSEHPWNPTLEHYSCYKAADLKTAVIAMQDLQLNTGGCQLNAIREKYRNQKFNCVASLSPSKSVQSLF